MIDRLIGALVIVALVILGGWWFKGKLAENQRLRDTVAVHEQAAAEMSRPTTICRPRKRSPTKPHPRRALARRRRDRSKDTFRGNLNARVHADPVSNAWAAVPVPAAVAECVRDPGACSGATGGTSRAAGMDVRPNAGAAGAGPAAKP
jgi:hypothetical protein